MCRVLLKTCGYCAASLALVLVGYMIAVISFREQMCIDRHSGIRKTVSSVPGFSLSREHRDNGFRILFGRSCDVGPEWLIISREHLISALDQEMVTQGETLARAENHLVVALMHKNHVREEIARMSRGFYSALSTGGVEAAAEYARREHEDSLRERFETPSLPFPGDPRVRKADITDIDGADRS